MKSFSEMAWAEVEGEDIVEYDAHPMDDPRYRNGGQGFIDFMNEFVRIPIYYKGDVVPVWTPLGHLPDEEWRPNVSYRGFWELQCDVAREALAMKDGMFKHRQVVFCWGRGEGKTLVRGTEVIMFDGTLKKVEDVRVGDLLMGDDNMPRKILSLSSGREELFEVVPNRGEPFTATKGHKISLKRTNLYKRGKLIADAKEKEFIDITIEDYQKQSQWFKGKHFLYRVPIDWPEQPVPIDPYFLGCWLADGTSTHPHITTMDQEVVDSLQEYAVRMGMRVSVSKKSGCNKAFTYCLVRKIHTESNILLDLLRDCNLINNKHIPQVYKANSREVRLQILAGMIDGDGYVNRNSFQLTLKNEQLSNDIVFIARSLGFHANITPCTKGIKSSGFIGNYFRVGISGDCSVIPTRVARRKCPVRSDWKDILVTQIKEIRSVGEQDYFGFMTDGNHRYLLKDFTVTHNSFLAVLIQIWKFMCWNAQTIMLGANSKDQIKFVHFDIIRDIILNSPALSERIGGKKQVQEKEVRRYVGGGQDEVRYNIIRAISSFSGIVSNITGYTFSEIFDMKNLKFYYQLDGSIRNIPNALGVIDSTVSTKDHILYTLYEIYKKNQDDTLFFSYRFSMKGMEVDYWNPQMHQKQLDSYRIKFPPAEFARYFLNTWSSGAASMFTPAQVLSIYYTGTTESTKHRDLMQVLNEKAEIIELLGTKRDDDVSSAMNTLDEDTHYNRVRDLDNMLVPVHRMYHVDNNYGIATLEDLNALSTKYDTDFSILMGVDRSDPMALQGARSIFTLVAKGCVGSRHIEYAYKDKQALEYVYFLIGLDIIEPNTLSHMKNLVIRCNEEFDDVDVICSERWGMWDLAEWAETQNIKYEAISSTYDRQRTYFSELYTAVAKGCFKSPFISVPGTRRQDILKEEMEIFIQDDNSRWFGSPEKKARGGIQDDVMFSLGCALFGGLSLTVDDFRLRKTGETGFFFSQEKTVAPY